MPRNFYKTPPSMPSKEEVESVLRLTNSEDEARDHLLIAVAAGTGLRVMELVALNWDQMITESGKARKRVVLNPARTKGGWGGEIVLSTGLRWKIERYREWCRRKGLAVDGDAPVFMSRNHRRLSIRQSQKVWKNLQVRANFERHYGFHSLRHFFGTTIYRMTRDIRITQVLLRHRSVATTMIYSHVTARDVEAAVERLG